MQVPGSTLGPELAALLDNSEGADINFKVCHKIYRTVAGCLMRKFCLLPHSSLPPGWPRFLQSRTSEIAQ